jgi:hypothetical protein
MQKGPKRSRAKYAAHPHAGPPPHLAPATAPARNLVLRKKDEEFKELKIH